MNMVGGELAVNATNIINQIDGLFAAVELTFIPAKAFDSQPYVPELWWVILTKSWAGREIQDG